MFSLEDIVRSGALGTLYVYLFMRRLPNANATHKVHLKLFLHLIGKSQFLAINCHHRVEILVKYFKTLNPIWNSPFPECKIDCSSSAAGLRETVCEEKRKVKVKWKLIWTKVDSKHGPQSPQEPCKMLVAVPCCLCPCCDYIMRRC